MRIVLLVALAVVAALDSLFVLIGVAGEYQIWSGGEQDVEGLVFLFAFIAILVLSVLGLVGVWRRTSWGRWLALAAGIGTTLTCVGAVAGIPIIVGAAKASWVKRPAT